MPKPNKVSSSCSVFYWNIFPSLGGIKTKPFSTKTTDHINLNTWWSVSPGETCHSLKSKHSTPFVWRLGERRCSSVRQCAELDRVRSCALWTLHFIWWWTLSCFFSVFPTLVLLNWGQILLSSSQQQAGPPERGSRVQAAGWLMVTNLREGEEKPQFFLA